MRIIPINEAKLLNTINLSSYTERKGEAKLSSHKIEWEKGD
jgi:hypothetical protein